MLMFVYGTLKQGHVNSPLLTDQNYLGRCWTSDKHYRMFNVPGARYNFPALTKATDGGYSVFGELYDVSKGCKKVIDQLEGIALNSPLYTCEEIKCQYFKEGEKVEVEAAAYFFARETTDLDHCGRVWPSADLNAWLLEGKRLSRSKEDQTQPGVRLWNKKTDSWRSPPMFDLDELQHWAAGKRANLGAAAGGFWSADVFEMREFPYEKTVDCLYLRDENADTKESPAFDEFSELCEWSATNSELFGGDKVDARQWAHLLETLR